MKILIAGIPGASSSRQLERELTDRGIETGVFALAECRFDTISGRVFWKRYDFSDCDAIVVRKLGDATDPLSRYRINLLYHLESVGVPVISAPAAIDEANDRYRMTMGLVRAGIPMPETVVTESFYEACTITERWGKAVLKPLMTSKGRGMVILDREGPYRLTLKHWQDVGRFPYYLQRFLPVLHDTGVAVLNGQVLGAFNRVSGGSWQTTIRKGGHYEPCQPDETMRNIALTAAAAFSLDYTVVDIVRYASRYYVYEVSAFGGFSGLASCNINAAGIYADYVIQKIRGVRKTR